MNDVTIFQETAVCLTKFGPDSGQVACKILRRKEWERRSGRDEHEHEFWWGIGEQGTDQSIHLLIEEHKAKSVIFVAAKTQTLKKMPLEDNILVWRHYRTLAGDQGIIPENVLVTSSISRSNYFALVCKNQESILVCNSPDGRQFANRHYKYLKNTGELGSSERGQRTTSPLVRYTTDDIIAADCDSVIEFSADFAEPNCVRLCDRKPVSFAQIDALKAIRNTSEWLSAVAAIRE
jgi:hypothetical protein